MAERKALLLQLDPRLNGALEEWAADELSSLNGQLEYLLREALRRAGRLPKAARAGKEMDTEDEILRWPRKPPANATRPSCWSARSTDMGSSTNGARCSFVAAWLCSTWSGSPSAPIPTSAPVADKCTGSCR